MERALNGAATRSLRDATKAYRYIRAGDRGRQRPCEEPRSSGLLGDAVEAIPNGLCIYDSREKLVLCNTAFAAPYGKSPAEMIGKSATEIHRLAIGRMDLIDGEAVMDPDAWRARLLNRMRDGSGQRTEARFKDGRWIQFSSHPTSDGGRVFVRSDITPQKQAEIALREGEQLFRQMVESHPLPVWLTELESGKVVYESPAAAALVGRSWPSAEPHWVTDYYAEPSARREYLEQLCRQGEVRDCEVQLKRVDGTCFWTSATSRLLTYKGRNFVLTANVDVTERNRREQELRAAHELLEDAIDALAEGFALYDAEDRLVMCNRRYREVNDWIADLLVPGTPWPDMLRAGAERGQYAAALGRSEEWFEERRRKRALERASGNGQVEAELSDGRWVLMSSRRTRQGGTVGLRTDITTQKQMQQALRESEERFRGIAEAHPVPVIIIRKSDGVLLYASPATSQLWGKPQDEIIGSTIREYYVDEDERRAARMRFQTDGRLDNYEVRHLRSDGAVIPVALNSRPITYDGHDAVVCGIVDLTERKEAERRIAEQQEALHQSEKLNALGSLLTGVAHELNNPLLVVVGQALMLQESVTDPAIVKRAERIGAAADRCARIVKTFLQMARQQPPKREAVDLEDVVDAALDLTRYALRGAEIELVRNGSGNAPEVWADRDQLCQVLINLIINAQQAMAEIPAPRRLSISITANSTAEAVLTVEDSGPGIPPELRARIFEPFFTTKPVGTGTGIGLAVTRGIVEAHGGTISVHGKPGCGAVFKISLPAAPAHSDRGQTESIDANTASSRILVVDDEPEILQTLADILTVDGHVVATALSGNEALTLIDGTSFDAILSDLRMPGLDGPGLYGQLKATRPELIDRMAFMTGDTLRPSVRSFLDEAGRPYLDKPFTPHEARVLLSRLIEGIEAA